MSDWSKSLVLAVIVAVLNGLLQLLNAKGLDLTMVDWKELGTVALTALVGYLVKNVASDGNGRFLGKI